VDEADLHPDLVEHGAAQFGALDVAVDDHHAVGLGRVAQGECVELVDEIGDPDGFLEERDGTGPDALHPGLHVGLARQVDERRPTGRRAQCRRR
jgi:hypothetical protein